MENDQKGATGGEDTVDDKIMEQGAVVFRGYVIQSVNRDDPRMHLVPEDLGGRADEGQEPEVKEVVLRLRKIAEDLNRDAELERLLDAVDLDSVQDVFFSVARKIFADEVSWGRVVAFFHFAYRLIYKALTQNHTEIIHRIIAWVLQFIRENISSWIRQHGGWEGVLNCVLRWNNVTIFAAGILTGALLYWKMAN
ncbi:apoptosis regulator BAX [Anguilla rostrata]|uniref:Bcl-2 Bcl-2 homology region 1-3 domain-containing protein n=1 Tax=Anguilla anguilla TaxID=7936 RepID=A0A9D3RRC9_ANGAN|nr:apoptosis regulator BAX [Anguilla anguilla]KAG5840000.1 hypothetical protein ANANG_G00211490 [Anguilla anguilla]